MIRILTLCVLCLIPCSLLSDGFGFGSGCGLTTTIENRIWATRDSPESTGTLDSAKVYLSQNASQVHYAKIAVYKVSDSSLVDSTEVILLAIADAWVYFDFIGNCSVFASTEYAIAVWSNVETGVCNVGFNTTGGNGSHWGQVPATYGAWSTKWTGLNQSGNYCVSIYAYYTPVPVDDVVRAIQCPDGAFQISGPNPSYISGP